ncbi:MAG: excinuclease ABC subunit UvrA, partial [Muribaculaceae bacterium]|nr:excinuclease ABC subunit UvrA [Muribaculaceae bacterium]
FLKSDWGPCCHGTRLSEAARAPRIACIGLDVATAKTLSEAIEWVKAVPGHLPPEMQQMASNIGEAFLLTARRLVDLGLGYLSLDRASSTLSTGERQRMQLARVVRNRTTGVLYVLDEPSIGLHPANINGLKGVMQDLIDDGNSIILVDHDTQILRDTGWLVELGPGAGADGGRIIAEGTIKEIEQNPDSKIAPFLSGEEEQRLRPIVAADKIFDEGCIEMTTSAIHTVRPLDIKIPKGRLTVVTGVSGSGKTTMVLESVVPGLQAMLDNRPLPGHVVSVNAPGIKHVRLIDSTPIGANVRSTVATYANIHDELRKIFSRSPAAKSQNLKAGDFSYNTGKLRCPVCDGTGVIDLDVQFLPDVTIPCPEFRGSRYGKDANR